MWLCKALEFPKCKETFAAWLVRDAAAYANRMPAALNGGCARTSSSPLASGAEAISGLATFLKKVSIPLEMLPKFEMELIALGAVDVCCRGNTERLAAPNGFRKFAPAAAATGPGLCA